MSLKYLRLEEAAERSGLSVTYLEMLEREGLITVKRTLDDVVVISSADLDRARVAGAPRCRARGRSARRDSRRGAACRRWRRAPQRPRPLRSAATVPLRDPALSAAQP